MTTIVPQRFSSWWMIGMIVCASHVVVPTSRAAETKLEAPPGRWIRVEMNSFTMIANTSEKRAIELGRHLERLRAVLDLLTPEDRARVHVPLRVFVFDRAEHFAPYKPLHEGKPANVSGWFVSVTDGGFLAIDGSVPEQRLQLLYHELVHAWLSANEPLAPLWVHEGLAEYFSTFTTEDGVLVMGEPIEHHLERLRRGRPLSATRLMSLGTNAPEYNESERQSMYYAQCWALLHMLMSDRERRQGLQSFLRHVHEGELAVSAIEQGFGVSFDVLEDELRTYVEAGEYRRFRIPADRLPALEHEPRVAPVDEGEALVELGELVVRLKQARPGVAEAHFSAALVRDPESARAHRGLATVHFAEGRRAEAIAALERAIAIDPRYAAAHVQLGWEFVDEWMRRQAHVDDVLLERAPEALARARAHFEAALVVEPELTMAQAGLGVTYVMDRDPTAGIAAMESVVSVMPWRADLLAHHVRLLANGGRVEEARALLDRDLRRKGSAEEVDFAETAVVNAELREVGRLVERDRFSDALALLTRSLETTREPRFRTVLTESLERVARAAGSRRGVQEAQRFVTALTAFGEDRLGEARAIAEELARTARNARLRERASELVGAVDAAESVQGAVRRYQEAVDLVAKGRVEEAREVLRRLLRRPGLDAEIADRTLAFLDELGG